MSIDASRSMSSRSMHAAVERRSAYARVPAAFRLHLVNKQLVWVPLIVFLSAWALSLGIGLWVQEVDGDLGGGRPVYTGTAQAALWAIVFLAAYSGSHTFPFSLALSFSRRVYMLGTLLAFLGMALCYGAAFAVAAAVEEATGGVGMEIYGHALPFLMTDGAWAAGLAAATVTLTLMLGAFGVTMLYKRVSVLVLWLVILALAVVAAVTVLLIVQAVGWDGVWSWFARQTVFSLIGWSGLAAVVLVAVDYALIRRATP